MFRVLNYELGSGLSRRAPCSLHVLLHLTDPEQRAGGRRHQVGLEVPTSLYGPPRDEDGGLPLAHQPPGQQPFLRVAPQGFPTQASASLIPSPAVPSPRPWASGNTSSAFWEPPWAQTRGEAPTIASVPRTADLNRLLLVPCQARDT